MQVINNIFVIMAFSFLMAACGKDKEGEEFNFSDLEHLEQAEQQELLEQARQHATSENLILAEKLLNQAKFKGFYSDKVKVIERLISSNREAEKKKEREFRLAHVSGYETKQQSRLAVNESTKLSPVYISITFESVCGFVGCNDKNLQITGGPGSFSPGFTGSSMGAIHKGHAGLSGRYNWSAEVDNKYCSGIIYISGKKANVEINVYKDCRDAGTREY